jgi:hypothetical protein
MDIIFKFGEHYYNSDDNSFWIQFGLTILGGFLGFGFALYIYYISIKREKKEQDNNLTIANKNKLKYHKLLIENLIKSTENQINSINKYKINQEKDLLNAIPPRLVITNDFKRLIFLNKDVFDSFNHINKNNNNWIEYLKKIHTTTDYIEGVYGEMYRITTNHLKNNYKKNSEVKQNIELISDVETSM